MCKNNPVKAHECTEPNRTEGSLKLQKKLISRMQSLKTPCSKLDGIRHMLYVTIIMNDIKSVCNYGHSLLTEKLSKECCLDCALE